MHAASGWRSSCLILLGTGSFDGLNETFWWLDQLGLNPLEFPGRSAVDGTQTVLGLIAANIALIAAIYGHMYLAGAVHWRAAAARDLLAPFRLFAPVDPANRAWLSRGALPHQFHGRWPVCPKGRKRSRCAPERITCSGWVSSMSRPGSSTHRRRYGLDLADTGRSAVVDWPCHRHPAGPRPGPAAPIGSTRRAALSQAPLGRFHGALHLFRPLAAGLATRALTPCLHWTFIPTSLRNVKHICGALRAHSLRHGRLRT